MDRAVDRIVAALAATLKDPKGLWILDPAHTEVESEFRLTGFVDGGVVNGILDRAFRDADGVLWVVDYKTSAHEGADRADFLKRKIDEYRPQLDQYAELLGKLKGEDPARIRRMLYFPLLETHHDWSGEE